MCVPFQHVQGAVTGNGCNLHNVQCAELEQTADGLMAEIVKMQIFYFQIQKCDTPGAFETGRGVTEHIAVYLLWQNLQVVASFPGEWNIAW